LGPVHRSQVKSALGRFQKGNRSGWISR
jgi:hypothetical protein